jgi:hypothetical protein
VAKKMAWETALAAMAVVCAASVAAAGLALALAVRRWNRTAARMAREAECVLAEWRRFTAEAASAVRAGRGCVEAAETLARGGRALGEAAEYAADRLAATVGAWDRRIHEHLAASAARQTHSVGAALDWTELAWSVWQSCRARMASDDAAERSAAPRNEGRS